MNAETVTGNSQLVEEIVRRVMLRLQDLENASVEIPSDADRGYVFPGRLLTSQQWSALPCQSQLIVDTRCVVTPEVVDLAKRANVKLIRKPTVKALPHGREVTFASGDAGGWVGLQGGAGQIPWLDALVAKWWGCQVVRHDCWKVLADQAGAAGQVPRLLITDHSYRVQRQLNQKSLFAVVVEGEAFEDLLQANPAVLIVRQPVTSWQLTRLLRQWKQRVGEVG